ncbi:MAG: peptidyl-dipeptidase A [Myxococcota bacterium]|jgi:peptidyl-dipeptidase A
MRTLLIVTTLAACSGRTAPTPSGTPDAPTDAKSWIEGVDTQLHALWHAQEEAWWAYETDITDANEAVAVEKEEAVMAFLSEVVPQVGRFDDAKTDPATARQLMLLRRATPLPAPPDAALRAELAGISAELSGMYGKGEYCTDAGCRDLGELEAVMSTSRDPAALLDAWQGWRTVSPPMKSKYARFVELGNAGAKANGFDDLGDLWRSGYDMEPDAFETDVDRLWDQVRPLYEQLHCHVRAELQETYGDAVPASGPLPAHLLGNMWSQSWGNIYPLVEPYPGQASLDVTATLKSQGWDDQRMVKTAEGFFMSLGLDPLPDTFWERSMFLKPADREVVCHASAWDVGMRDDLRIKMCIRPTMEDLVTIHHELGHLYYDHYYHTRPVLFQQGANDGFHEAIGDAIALSITPTYLKSLGLLEEVSESDEAVINKQMLDALDKVAFLPFGRMIDQWRWEVFDGRVTPAQYNERWWELRRKYQGIVAPIDRADDAFDPGAKYHIPANTPYMRYFLAAVLQFQFHRAMCERAGHEGPLHTCSVYGSKEAGTAMRELLALGASKPWPDALEAMTGTRQADASALREYFAPLEGWLAEQNEGRSCGW